MKQLNMRFSLFTTATFLILLCFFTNHGLAQSKFKNSVGVYFTGDAGMYYYGTSFIGNSEYRINDLLGFNLYIQYFQSNDPYSDLSIKAIASGLLGHVYLGMQRKFYLGLGLAYERMTEKGLIIPGYDLIDRALWLPAYRLGYHFEWKKLTITPEINLTGPYHEEYENGSSTEIFTLPSIGVRLHYRL